MVWMIVSNVECSDVLVQFDNLSVNCAGNPALEDKIHTPRIVYDLSANGRRLVQNASEYTATICKGEVIFEAGEATKAIPSRVLRRTQAAPSQS